MESLLNRWQLRDHVSLWCFWWGAWTLADLYLIHLSPWSEFCVLGVGLSLYVVPELVFFLRNVVRTHQNLAVKAVDRL